MCIYDVVSQISNGNDRTQSNDNVQLIDQREINRKIFKEIYDVVKKLVGQREMSAQEAAFEGYNYRLITYSSNSVFVHAMSPQKTMLKVKKIRHGNNGRDNVVEFYDPQVTRYVNSMFVINSI
jgi:hypothetical protein